MTDAINNYAAGSVMKLDGVGGMGSTGNIQLLFAQLQMELAQTNKESALEKIDQIRESQAESAAITEAINALRNLKSELDATGKDDIDISRFGTFPADMSDEERQAQITKLQECIDEGNSQRALSIKGKSDDAQGNANKAVTGYKDCTAMSVEAEKFLKDNGVFIDNDGNDRWHNPDEWDDNLNAMAGRMAYLQAGDLCEKYGIELPSSGKLTPERIDTVIASLQAVQEETGSDIQQEMVFVQDFMGQYKSYTQGASSAISSASETLKTVARG